MCEKGQIDKSLMGRYSQGKSMVLLGGKLTSNLKKLREMLKVLEKRFLRSVRAL